MSRVTRQENFRVCVTPSVGWGAIATDEDCKLLISKIKRHIDDFEHLWVESGTVSTCQHCGHAWTEKSPDYNGGCCEKDQSEDEAKQVVALASDGGK